MAKLRKFGEKMNEAAFAQGDGGWMSYNHKSVLLHDFEQHVGVNPSMANQAAVNDYLNNGPGMMLDQEEKEFLREVQDGSILPLNKYDTSYLLYVKWAVDNDHSLLKVANEYNKQAQIELNGDAVNVSLVKLESIANRLKEGTIVVCTDYDGVFVGMKMSGKVGEKVFFNAAAYDHRKGLNAATMVMFIGKIDPDYIQPQS